MNPIAFQNEVLLESQLIGNESSYLLLSDGTVFHFGDSQPSFDLKNRIHANKSRITQLNLSFIVNQMYVGNGHVLFLSNDNKVYGQGSNQCGQLGIPISECSRSSDIIELKLIEEKHQHSV